LSEHIQLHVPVASLDYWLPTQQNQSISSPTSTTDRSITRPIEMMDESSRIQNSIAIHADFPSGAPIAHGSPTQDPSVDWYRSPRCSREQVECSERLAIAGTTHGSQADLLTRQLPLEDSSADFAPPTNAEPSQHHSPTCALPIPPASQFEHSLSPPTISRVASFILLVISSILVSSSAFFLTNTVDAMVTNTPLSEEFISLILLPMVGNAAEYITAMTVASKNKMDLAIGVSVGSSIQIAVFVTPAVVLLGWLMERQMTLYFSLFEAVTLVAAVGLVVLVMQGRRTNYLGGSLLCICYIIVG
jgi:Ca2+/H+ antiporter